MEWMFCALTLIASGGAEPVAGSMDGVSVFSFSQSGLSDPLDTQIVQAKADLNIRTFNAWANGLKVSEYNPQHLTAKAAGTIPTGGLSATVVFRSEAPSDSAYLDWISRDANGDTVPHDEIVPGAHRGSLASAGFRRHLMELVKTQIDFGTYGIFFDEVDGGFNGGSKWNYNGNEGFDDHHLKEFNVWLANRFPSYSKSDFVKAFGMPATNALDPSKPLDDLVGNFNYRTYLQTKGWSDYPNRSNNPLAALYGSPVGNRMVLHATNFLDSSNTAHWREIVEATRDYARSKGREILVTSNGIEPFVDFNSYGLYKYNKDGHDGSEVVYVPVSGAELDAKVSLLDAFQTLRRRSKVQSGDAPLAVFLDWPCLFMDSYYALSPRRKMDYWRVYGAEAYAAGIFFAFHLRTAMPQDPSATKSGILDSLTRTIAFYRGNGRLFHGLEWDLADVQTNSDKVVSTRAWQGSSRTWIVHLVNHDDRDGLVAKRSLEVSLPLDSAPASVTKVTPDEGLTPPRPVPFSHANGLLTATVDSLVSSAILEIRMGPSSGTATKPVAVRGVRLVRSAEGTFLERAASASESVRLRQFDPAGRELWTKRVDGSFPERIRIPDVERPGILQVEGNPPQGPHWRWEEKILPSR
jgi:hypothetical protein